MGLPNTDVPHTPLARLSSVEQLRVLEFGLLDRGRRDRRADDRHRHAGRLSGVCRAPAGGSGSARTHLRLREGGQKKLTLLCVGDYILVRPEETHAFGEPDCLRRKSVEG